MTIRRVVYVSNARLPTEKAHGYAIAKMCEALGRRGLEVQLWHRPRRSREPISSDLFEYYGVERSFEVNRLAAGEVKGLRRFFPGRSFVLVTFARGLWRGVGLALAAKRHGADLYWTRDATVAFWLVAVGVPTLYEVHSIPRSIRRWFIRRASRSDGLRGALVLTRDLRDRLVGLGVPESKIAVFPNAVDPDGYKGLPSAIECRRQLGLPSERPIVAYVGRFRSSRGLEKGIPQLLEAMAAVDVGDRGRPVLVCVGGPMDAVAEYTTEARRLGLAADSVQFFDRVPPDQVPLWIRAADVVTIPWWTRPDAASPAPPLKLFEYMAAGAAIVATDLDEITDFLEDGVTGIVVPRDAPARLAAAISRLLADNGLRDRLATSAASRAHSYSWNRRAEVGLALAESAAT